MFVTKRKKTTVAGETKIYCGGEGQGTGVGRSLYLYTGLGYSLKRKPTFLTINYYWNLSVRIVRIFSISTLLYKKRDPNNGRYNARPLYPDSYLDCVLLRFYYQPLVFDCHRGSNRLVFGRNGNYYEEGRRQKKKKKRLRLK